MAMLIDRFGELRRWLPKVNITDHIHRERLLFAVASFDECFLTRARPPTTLPEVKREPLWSRNRRPRPLLICSLMATRTRLWTNWKANSQWRIDMCTERLLILLESPSQLLRQPQIRPNHHYG